MATIKGSFPTNLKAHWKLEETSGIRYDAHGVHDLTDNNTVGSTTGKLRTAASFVGASSEYLSVADNSDFEIGSNDFAISFWVYFPSSVSSAPIISKSDYSSNRSYRIYDWGTNWRWRISTTGSNDVDVFDVNVTSYITANAWHHIVITRNSSVTKGYINGTERASASDSNTYYNGGGAFQIGGDNAGAYTTAYVDEVSFWNGTGLSAGNVTTLYNSGSGIHYENWKTWNGINSEKIKTRNTTNKGSIKSINTIT